MGLEVEADRAYRESETTILPKPYCDDPAGKVIMLAQPWNEGYESTEANQIFRVTDERDIPNLKDWLRL